MVLLFQILQSDCLGVCNSSYSYNNEAIAVVFDTIDDGDSTDWGNNDDIMMMKR